MSVRSIADAVISALIAPPCAGCRTVLDRPLSGAVCDACWQSLPTSPSVFTLPSIGWACALGAYDGVLREIIHALKYDGRRSIAPRLSAVMAQGAADLLRDAGCVVPVPLHSRRLRERGFNQAEELARGLTVPIVNALERVRPTPPQVGLPESQRRANVADAFALTHRARRVSFQSPRDVIVLVDDVATTGATLEACARVLKEAGVREVRAITAARVESAPH